MNLYLLVEGEQTEKRVYRAWLQHAFPALREIPSPDEVGTDTFYLLAGKGYPSYLSRIRDAAADVTLYPAFDRLMICVDAEELPYAERHAEIVAVIEQSGLSIPADVVVQTPCIETWFLGNPRVIQPNPSRSALGDYLSHYNVRTSDPEEMASGAPSMTRAAYHHDYFKEACREKGLRYSKRRPGPVLEPTYLQALKRRWEETGHIPSFGAFLTLLSALGGEV